MAREHQYREEESKEEFKRKLVEETRLGTCVDEFRDDF